MLNSSRFLNFCIFDGLKCQNINRGLTLFEIFGAPVKKEISDLLKTASADDVNCCIELDEDSVKSIKLQVQTSELCENLLEFVDTSSNYLKWKAFHSFAMPRFLCIELNSNGFSLRKISLI